MRIAYKLHITNVSAIVLIVLVGVFSYKNLNLVLTKLRFIEIADDLNASFLEMRLNEKNYFLYHDKAALNELRSKLSGSIDVMDSLKTAIIKATGEENYEQLNTSCINYLNTLDTLDPNAPLHPEVQERIRETGRRLREFSRRITSLERRKMNEIILKSRKELFTTLCLILLSAISVSYLFFFNIILSLKKIKSVTRAISEGNVYQKIETDIPKDEIGSVLKAINVMVSELEKREEQIIQSKKLASIGILTAGVAHELGNPLNNISMVAQTYLEFYRSLSEEERLGFMKMVEEEADRIKEIVDNLLDFSKPKKQNLAPSEINAIVLKSLKLVQNMIHISNIDVVMNLGETLPGVLVDGNRIVEVLVNLITNAIHAMSPGGMLTITTQTSETENEVQILISDTGKGIPSVILPHLFDPFFSTKGTQGTGLGLFVSYGIITNHGGNIKADSQEGVGTTFTISLPVPENPHVE